MDSWHIHNMTNDQLCLAYKQSQTDFFWLQHMSATCVKQESKKHYEHQKKKEENLLELLCAEMEKRSLFV